MGKKTQKLKRKPLLYTGKFNCCTFKVAAEQKARATYEKLIDLSRDNPDVVDVLRYLRQREIVHFQRFGETLRNVQDLLMQKRCFMMNDGTTNTNIVTNNNVADNNDKN